MRGSGKSPPKPRPIVLRTGPRRDALNANQPVKGLANPVFGAFVIHDSQIGEGVVPARQDVDLVPDIDVLRVISTCNEKNSWQVVPRSSATRALPRISSGAPSRLPRRGESSSPRLGISPKIVVKGGRFQTPRIERVAARVHATDEHDDAGLAIPAGAKRAESFGLGGLGVVENCGRNDRLFRDPKQVSQNVRLISSSSAGCATNNDKRYGNK